MPIFGEQVEEHLLLRMFVNDIFLNLKHQTRSLGQSEATIHRVDLWQPDGTFANPSFIEIVKVLLNLEVGYSCGEVD